MSVAEAAERALLHELLHWWSDLNHRHFHGRMRPPVLQLQNRQLGRWQSQSRTITLGADLLAQQPWGVVLEVLRHEMAHQYVDEVLGVRDEAHHGIAFRAVCAAAGIDPSSRGLPVAVLTEDDRVLGRIQRLLALAESPNVHESQAAMNAAQRLMLKHNIALSTNSAARRYGFRQLGHVSGRVPTHEKILGGILCGHFFVRGIYVQAYDVATMQRGRVLEVVGSDENLDIAAYVYDFLQRTAERLWIEHRRSRGIRNDRERRRYLAGVMVGFNEKLTVQARESREAGLVWVGDPRLEDFLGQRYPTRTSGRRSLMTTSSAWHEGREAGREIILRKPIEQGPSDERRQLTDR